MAQLGARFHGMEEVVSSNLTRSTKKVSSSRFSRPVTGNLTPTIELDPPVLRRADLYGSLATTVAAS